MHGLDIRLPLGLPREIPEERLRTSLAFVASGGFGSKRTVSGLRFEADDLDWAAGSGSVVRGGAEALLLAMTGRSVALDRLSGGGVPTLRSRLT
ncbi:hypothetical protein [Blastococcus sp. TBT05-19]|uniref:hypothetical protein n=1 Tax=Blastococcus sp. TBT05-19 TaxID=2250581 RepID=UPI0011BF10C7|nr:hypothetical protein [Blastococcus sp. TBT05-19]